MLAPGQARNFLHQAHVLASTVREVLEEKCLRESTDLELTLAQLTLIQLIANNGDHQVCEIAAFFGVSPAAASKSVEKLVRMGLIERTVKQEDRRAVSLNLTLEGKRLIRRYEGLKKRKVERAFSNLSADEVDRLTRYLERTAYSILEKEGNFGEICFKCSALYDPDCALRPLHDACVYRKARKTDSRCRSG